MPEKKKTCISLFQSCEETKKPEVVQINGSIPEWLNGTFLRVGPGKWDFPGGFTMNHWFDGYALLSKFSIHGGSSSSAAPVQTVALEQKFLNSEAYVRGCRAQKTVITEFGTRAYPDPQKSFLSRLICSVLPVELSDNGNLNLFTLGSSGESEPEPTLFATSETCYFRDVNLKTMCSNGNDSGCGEKYDTNKYFGVNIASAHPLTDPETKVTYNIGSTVLTGLKYNIIKIPAAVSVPVGRAGSNSCNHANANANANAKEILKRSKIIATIPTSHTGLLSHIHSFGMSRNYVIFIEQPYVMNITRAAKTIFKGSPVFKDFVEWRPELRNRFHVIEKETGVVIKTEYIAQENFFYLHIINAYEDSGQIVIDLMAYKNADFMDATYLTQLRDGCINEHAFQASAHRYVLPIISNTIAQTAIPENTNLVEIKSHALATRVDKIIILTPEILSSPGLEYPVLNKKYLGQKCGYFYASGTPGSEHQYSHSIVKYDTRKKECMRWIGMVGQLAGEVQFVPNPNATSCEDDGILISIVSDMNPEKNTFILFLDAKTMEEVGRAQFQTQLPLAIHGIYLPSTSTASS